MLSPLSSVVGVWCFNSFRPSPLPETRTPQSDSSLSASFPPVPPFNCSCFVWMKWKIITFTPASFPLQKWELPAWLASLSYIKSGSLLLLLLLWLRLLTTRSRYCALGPFKFTCLNALFIRFFVCYWIDDGRLSLYRARAWLRHASGTAFRSSIQPSPVYTQSLLPFISKVCHSMGGVI